MQDYRSLTVWQDAHQLVKLIYPVVNLFPSEERFNLTSQLNRAVVSVPTNIAEGCVKLTNADKAKFFQIALGSLQETEYLTFLSFELGFVKSNDFEVLEKEIGVVKGKLINLIKRVRA